MIARSDQPCPSVLSDPEALLCFGVKFQSSGGGPMNMDVNLTQSAAWSLASSV